MDLANLVLLLASLMALLLPAVSQRQEDILDLDSDDLTPIEILKKGQSIMMCLVHPRNCPGGFRKRDSSTKVMTQRKTTDPVSPFKKYFVKIVQNLIQKYIDRHNNEASQREIVVDYIPQRILVSDPDVKRRR